MDASSPAASVASADIAAEFAALTVEEQEQQRNEWQQVCVFSRIVLSISSNQFFKTFILLQKELQRVEEEINTLRTVLASKTRHHSDLKRKLGITVWKELTDNVKESSV